MQPEPESRPSLGAATWIAGGVTALLVVLVFARACLLEGEFYDAYEVRVEAQRLLDGSAADHPPTYRSPLLVLLAAGFQALGPGLGWVGPALVSALAYAILIACVALLARELGARPWVAASAGLLAATDHAAWVYASHGMSDVPAAAACALTLAVATRGDPDSRLHPVWTGVALAIAALIRPTAGVLGLAFVGGFRTPWTLPRLLAAAGTAAAVYLAVSTAYYAAALGSLSAALAAHGDVLRFMGDQVAENRIRLGGDHAGALLGINTAFLVGPFRSSPLLATLALAGSWIALRSGPGPARVVLGWAALHVGFLLLLFSHFEIRYMLLATPAFAALAGLGLERLVTRAAATPPWAPAAAVGAIAAACLGWSGPYELARLRDPAIRESFPRRVAEAAQAAAGPEARFSWTTRHPFPVAPRGVYTGRAYPGDMAYSIFHFGPAVIGYHLGQPVLFPLLATPDGRPHPGLTHPDELRAYVRGAHFEDGSRFRAGDVLLVGIARPSRAWDLRGTVPPPFGVGRVIQGPDGALDVSLSWLPAPGT